MSQPVDERHARFSGEVRVRAATPADAAEVHRIVVAAFRARPALDPPAPALAETPESIAAEISARGGLVATLRGQPVGSLLFGTGPGLRLTRVSVDPAQRRQRIAAGLVRAGEAVAVDRGFDLVSLVARRELSSNGAFWRSLGYGEVDPGLFPEVDRLPHNLTMARAVPFTVPVDGAAATRGLGQRLAQLLGPGDLVLLNGDLGAGKTTLTQGIGAGLGIRGPVTSPTFVLAREHPSLIDGPPLVHVDGYRLTGAPELDDLDLDAAAADAVTVVEWGRGMAEALASDRIEITLDRDASVGGPTGRRPAGRGPAAAEPGDELRTVRVDALGGRWAFAGLRQALGSAPAASSLG